MGLRNWNDMMGALERYLFPCPKDFIDLWNPSPFSWVVTCDDTPPLRATHPTAPQRTMTQATLSSREPATSHNSLHVNRPSNPRTGFGVHTPHPLTLTHRPLTHHPCARIRPVFGFP